MQDEQTRIIGDRIAATSGFGGAGAWTLSEWAHLANDVVPLLTALMLTLTCLWYLWRMVDRVRFGPGGLKGED